MEVALIVNSVAGRGRAGRYAGSLVDALEAAGSNVTVRFTDSAGGGSGMADAAGRTCDVVVAVGGDGTVNAVASGLYGSRSRAALGVAPYGSGNDFAKVLGMPHRPEDVASAILRSEPVELDAGLVEVRGDDERSALFVNAVGIGFDALVAARAQSSRKLRGVVGYLFVALKALASWRFPVMEVEADGESMGAGPTLLATAGNGTCSGGGFFLTPRAQPHDGLVDVCVVRRPTAAELPGLAAGILRGRHLAHPRVSYRQVREVAVRSPVPVFVHVDGEIVTDRAEHVRIRVLPAALRVIAPGA